MKIDIMTLFPEMINEVMRESIIGRAQDKGVVEVKATNIRDYALDKHHKADVGCLEMCIRDSVNADRAQEWIKNGAQPTDTVRGILKKAGVLN